MLTVTNVKKLPSGYWHVRFGREIFVQWRVGCAPDAVDVFHGGDDAALYADAALRAVELTAPSAAP